MKTQAINLYRPTRKVKISTYVPQRGENSQQALAASQEFFQKQDPGVRADDILVVEQPYSLEVYRFSPEGVPVFLNRMPPEVAAMIRA